MQHTKPTLLVVNPGSKSGRAGELIAETRSLLRTMGIHPRVETTSRFHSAFRIVRDAIDKGGFRLVLCLGGDGTFSDVARGVCAAHARREVCIGLLPAGTANDVARTFGIPSCEVALARNIRVILDGHTTELDAGVVDSFDDSGRLMHRKYFFDSLTWGLSPDILASRNRERETVERLPVIRNLYKDEALYVSAALRSFFRSYFVKEDFIADITVDGKAMRLERLTDLMIKGILVFCGYWIIDPTSKHDDGLFEIVPFRGRGDWLSKALVRHKLVTNTNQLLDRIGLSSPPPLRGQHIDVQLFRPHANLPIRTQADGDEFHHGDRFTIRVLPRHIRLIVPKDYHWI